MSTDLLNEVTAQALQLSREEMRQLASRLIEEAEKAEPAQAVERASDAEELQNKIALSMNWLAQHQAEFVGQWIALDGDCLISHGADARQVFAAARQANVKTPFVVQVESPDEPPFGGW